MYRESSLMINQQFWPQPQKKGKSFFLVKKKYHLPIFILIVNVSLHYLSVSFGLSGLLLLYGPSGLSLVCNLEYLHLQILL